MTKQTTTYEACPHCENGQLIPQVGDYITTLPDGENMTVPGIIFSVCDHCSERTISLAQSRKVEAYVSEQLELLSPAEIRAIREELGVDQMQMSEALGLGTKTYHRWEKGNQIPSRSMGYYLRTLRKHPEAFDWLRERAWRQPDKVVNVDFAEAFPALRKKPTLHYFGKFNAARALCMGIAH